MRFPWRCSHSRRGREASDFSSHPRTTFLPFLKVSRCSGLGGMDGRPGERGRKYPCEGESCGMKEQLEGGLALLTSGSSSCRHTQEVPPCISGAALENNNWASAALSQLLGTEPGGQPLAMAPRLVCGQSTPWLLVALV